MIKRALIALAFLALVIISVNAAPKQYLIDNFELGNITVKPVWYNFDKIVPTVGSNAKYKGGDATVVKKIGKYSLNLKGPATNWYVGGMGTMLGISASPYSSLEIDVYGIGENSGKLKVELYDNKSALFSNEIDVKWTGWKHLSVPFRNFKAKDNAAFNPKGKTGPAAGIQKVQLICVAFSETGNVNYNVDNISLGTAK